MPHAVRLAVTFLLCVAGTVSAAAEPRAARSVHLGYEAADAAAFSIEMTVLASTPGSYFMAAGWDTGYCGVQELADRRKVVIFSVWDLTTGDDPDAVREADRVECLFHAPDMRIKRFGNEGTGGQCLGDFEWKIGEPVRFGVTAVVEGATTAYAGYVWSAGADEWKHLVTFRTRTGGALLRGLYSFVEDFRRDGRSPYEPRRARFSDGWALTGEQAWRPLSRARFTASDAEWEARDRIDAAIDGASFLLATGGETQQSQPLGTVLEVDGPAAVAPPPSVQRLMPCRADNTSERVGRAADGRTITPVNQVLTPAGRQVELPGLRPQVLALSSDGQTLVTSGKTNEVVIVDPDTGEIRQRVKPPAGDAMQPPADADTARNLKPDTQAIASYTGLLFAPDGKRLYMSNVHGSVKVFAAADGRLTPSHSIPLPPANAPQRKIEIPAGLAVSADGTRLYVCGNLSNRLIEIDTGTGDVTEVLVGLVPTGWYPGAIVVDAARRQVAVANIKGLPEKPKKRGAGEGFNSHHYHGSLSLMPIPEAEALSAMSAVVDQNMRSAAIRAAFLPLRPDAPPRVIPERIGEPSLIEHVVYVIKENRTYDQVLGDVPRGRGRPDLCIFGPEITPNQHALAEQFVLLDNTYCCGILSADGHNWSTSATATDYLERSFAGFPRSYPDGMGDGETDALAWSPAGFIWDRCLEHKKTIRNYGEYMMPRVRWKDPARKGAPDFAACFAAWKAGPEQADVLFACAPAIESLRPFSPLDTVGWNMSVPDQFRADVVIRELAEFEKQGTYPNLVIICLPNDHTSGTTKGCPTPAACMADNDLALGRIVEALSKSRFWPKMAIVAIEDDPQNGWDHVSGYRTTCYVASPFAKRGAVVSTQYSSTSVLRTIGQILGLPPMNQFDASATPMVDCFTDVADLRPFTALPATVPLDQLNGDPQAILDPVLKAGAVASATMNFLEIDRAPEDALNRVLWHATKGSAAAYPDWATSPHEDDDEDDD